MSIAQTMMTRTAAATPLAAVINDGCTPIGGVFRLTYREATVLTDDWRKTNAGGVPLGAFLIAAAGTQTADGFVLDDQELILLRVRGTEALPNEADLVATRLAVVRDAGVAGVGYDDVTDILTRAELQQAAFTCEVLGTFYTDDGSDSINFGADIDNVVSSAKYQVFLPSSRVLSWLASYPHDNSDTLLLGTVRFSSTLRRARAAGVNDAPVRVHVTDFVSRKTALFGMTRTGKSNTIKTLVTAIHMHGLAHRQRIGQVIFDPQGEYANINHQDGTGLRLLGDDASQVVVYKHAPDPARPVERPLRINFLDPASLLAVWDMVQQEVADGSSARAQYMSGFRGISMDEPVDDPRARHHFHRNRLAFYALLHRAGIDGPLQQVTVDVPADAVAALEAYPRAVAGVTIRGRRLTVATSRAAADLLEWLRINKDLLSTSWQDDFTNGELGDMIEAMTGNAGHAAVKRLKAYHDPTAAGEIGQHVWADMQAGRLAIIDLSQGNGSVVKTMSERIVTTLLDNARDRFADGQRPRPFQIVVEEAHNLFERGASTVAGNPWVRLSKEAAKYKIGLMYATQEVSSVDQRVLSNTSNWLVGHLNSDVETRELSHYYDFATWADSVRRCEDVGFVRVKTYSGKYIVPIQVSHFDHDMVNAARRAGGLAPVASGITPTT